MVHGAQGSRAALLAASLLVASLSVSAFASQRERTAPATSDVATATQTPSADDQHTQARALREGRPLDLNLATADDLRLLPGIGPMLASRIVAHRARLGRFTHLAELDAVAGIGPKTLRRITPLLTLTTVGPASGSERKEPAR